MASTGPDSRPRPEDYFTPRSPVSQEMFSRREEGRLQQRLEDALSEIGSQIMLYGDTGVGKTSLLLHVAEEMRLGVARIECSSGKSFEDLIRDAFAAIAEVQELRLETVTTRSRSGEAEAGLSMIARLKARITSGESDTERREYEIVQQPMLDALIDVLVESNKRIIFFDNFENVSDGVVKQRVAELIGFISDRARDTGNVKVVLAGIAQTAGDLLTPADAASRRTVDFEVPRMPRDELAQIVTKGMTFLDLRISRALVGEITNMSDGFPFVTHLLGLHVAREARRDGAEEIIPGHLQAATSVAVSEFKEEFRVSYEAAKEQSGNVRPREHIMQALAWVEGRDFSLPEIALCYRERFRIDAGAGLAFLNPALGQLLTTGYGAVLKRRGKRRRYRYGFRNPLMRPFIRLMDSSERSSGP